MSAPTAELLESGVCHLPGVLAPEVLSWCRDMAGDRCQSVLRHLLLRQVVAGKPAPPRCERPIPALTTHATSPPPSTRAAKHPHSDLRHHRPVSRRANHLSVSCPHGHRYAEVVEQEGRRIEVKQRTTGVLVRAVLSAEPLRNLLLAALGVQLPPPRPVPAACRRTLTQSCIGVSRPWPVVGDDAECLAAGTLVAMSSSSWSEWSELEGRGEGGGNPEASPWRAEGTHLFDVDVPLPPYALTCYVPLNDLTPENGHSCPHYSPPLPLSPPPRSIIHCLAPRGSPCRSRLSVLSLRRPHPHCSHRRRSQGQLSSLAGRTCQGASIGAVSVQKAGSARTAAQPPLHLSACSGRSAPRVSAWERLLTT